MLRRPALLCGAAVLLGGAFGSLGGCGGEERAGELAELVPASAPLYVEGVVRPSADQRAALEQLGSPLLGGRSLGEVVVGRLDEQFSDEADAGRALTWARDVRPWLGSRAGVFFTRFEPESEGAVVVEVRDEPAARRAIEGAAEADTGKESEKTYEGVEYLLDEEDDAAGIVGGQLVVGSERDLRATVDALDGAPLAGDGAFDRAIEQAGGEDALGYAYLRPDGLIAQVRDRTDRRQAELFFEGVGLKLDAPSMVTVAAAGGAARAEARAALERRSGGGDTSALLATLPSDAWLGFASGDAGSWLGGLLTAFLRIGAANRGEEDQVAAITDTLEDGGIDLEDLGLGDVTVFAGGSGPQTLEVGLTAGVEDRGEAEALGRFVVGGLLDDYPPGRLPPLPGEPEGAQVRVPGLPQPLLVALTGERLVVALGAEAARNAFGASRSPSGVSRLGSSERLLGDGVETVGRLELDRLLAVIARFQGVARPRPGRGWGDRRAAAGARLGRAPRGRHADAPPRNGARVRKRQEASVRPGVVRALAGRPRNGRYPL